MPCVGDCGNDGEVTVDELLVMVNIALGSSDVEGCRAGDGNGDGEITVDEIIAGVNNALGGCPGAPVVSASFDFRNGALGWQAGFADYPASAAPDRRLAFRHSIGKGERTEVFTCVADIVKVGRKGELALPRRVRAALGLQEGDELVLTHDEESIVLKRKARRFSEYLDTLGRGPTGRERA